MKVVPAGKIVELSPKKMAKFGINPDQAEVLSGWSADYLDKKSALERAIASSGCIGSLKKYEKMTQADLDKLVENYSLEDYQLEEIQTLHQAYLEAAFDLETNFCLLREGKNIPEKKAESPQEQSTETDSHYTPDPQFVYKDSRVEGNTITINVEQRPSRLDVYSQAPIESIQEAKDVVSRVHKKVSGLLEEIRYMREQNAESRKTLRARMASLQETTQAEADADFARREADLLEQELDELERAEAVKRRAAGLDSYYKNNDDKDVPGR